MAVLEQQRVASAGRRRLPGWWLGVAVFVLLIAAVGAGVLIGRATGPDNAAQPKGLASGAVTKTLAMRIDAVNAGDTTKIASFYTSNAVLEERDWQPAVITRGAQAIAKHLSAYNEIGFQLTNDSAPIQIGPYTAEAATWSGGGRGILVYEFDSSGRIAHQWVITAPTQR